MHLENDNTYVRMIYIDYIDSETPFSTKLSDYLTVDKVLFFIYYFLSYYHILNMLSVKYLKACLISGNKDMI